MAFISKDAKWYIADIVEELHVEGEDTSLVHINLTLIRADSPDEAYQRSLEVGQRSEMTYPNPEGAIVTVRFRGLRNLHVIHEPLEHGSELLYERQEAASEAQIQKLLRSKAELNVFLPHRIED